MIAENEAWGRGAGAMVMGAENDFSNNTIVKNHCLDPTSSNSAGLALYPGSGMIRGANNILWGNIAVYYPNCYDDLELTYSSIPEGLAGVGNITDDPLFVDPGSYDYTLQEGSPCIDSGDPNSANDPDGTRADMGAFFFNQTPVKDDGDNAKPMEFKLLGSYPNPFNPVTVISFQLAAFSHVTLAVYDLSGRSIATLVDGFRQAGTHDVRFEAKELASGVYLYRLEAGENIGIGRMILLK